MKNVHSSLKDNICFVDLTYMQLINKFNKVFLMFFMLFIDVYSKYGWVALLQDKAVVTTINGFQNIS